MLFSQLLWGLDSGESERQGVAIDYPSLTMHGIVTHDPKYPEEHLVVIVQKKDDDDDEDESKCHRKRKMVDSWKIVDNTNNNQANGDNGRSDSPVEYDSIRTVNYRFVMASSEDLKTAYQIIAECQALHPDPLDDAVDEDEVGSGK